MPLTIRPLALTTARVQLHGWASSPTFFSIRALCSEVDVFCLATARTVASSGERPAVPSLTGVSARYQPTRADAMSL